MCEKIRFLRQKKGGEKNGYTISNDEEDKKFFTRVKEKFEQETGISLNLLFDFCNFLQVEFSEYNNNVLLPNVYEMDKELVKCKFKELVDSIDGKKYSSEQIKEVLSFLTINSDKLKERKGKTDFYLPINERENRNNRFEVNPIVEFGNKIIFSPVLLNNISNLWFNGLLNFMLPYEIGLNKFVRKNIDLYKIDKKTNYPIDLGDYDIIAVDEITKKIWIIESKALNRVGNFFEMYTQQRNFFLEHKYDEKFQRRIDFMNKNYKRILKSFGFIDSTGYQVVPYMIFNKVIVSRYKKLKFPLISIMELEEELRKNCNQL